MELDEETDIWELVVVDSFIFSSSLAKVGDTYPY